MKQRNWKKLFALTLALLLAMGVLAGCGDDGGSDDEGNAGGTNSGGNLIMATQDVGSAQYMYASAINNLWSAAIDSVAIDLTTTSPGGVGAPVILQNRDCDIVLGNAAPAKWAYEEGILGSAPTTDIRSIAGGLGSDFINIMFTQEFVNKTGITSVEQLVEEEYPVHIAVKANGSFGELACSKVLEVLGVDYETVKSWGGEVTQTGSDAIVSLLKDGKADMTIDHVGAGQSATTELTMTTSMFFPELAPSTIALLNEQGFDNIAIPAGTWTGQTNEIQSVGSPQVVLCHADLDEELVYEMTKAMCEGKEELVNANATLAAFDPATAWDTLKTGAPVHPGAERYYQEMGYMN